MTMFLKYLIGTGLADMKNDVVAYFNVLRQIHKANQTAVDLASGLMHSYDYFDEGHGQGCISYDANVKGVLRSTRLCPNFEDKRACNVSDCPLQAANAAYVAARRELDALEIVRKNFWNKRMRAYQK